MSQIKFSVDARRAGVLLPVASLPGAHGVGDFGKDAYDFVDSLHKGGFTLWQILPLNPLGYGHSPYQPFSSFAMDELYVDLFDLAEEGYLDHLPPFEPTPGKVSYERSREYKLPLLRKAFEAQMQKDPSCLEEFKEKEPWIKDFAAFMMFKRRDERSWDNWADRDWIKGRKPFAGKDKEDYDFEVWLQMTLYRQWGKLHAYALSKGIEIIGDIPFYVGFDSCDVWASQDSFLLDPSSKQPTFIAGVPPDYFSATGQRWGNPIYDWDKLVATDFAFIINRIVRNSKIYDYIRLDHFRAFDTYWKIPASCPTAIEGEWIEAPGYALFDRLLKAHPEIKIIAEDLGDLRPEVLTLRDHYNFPGMNVIEFTFDDDAIAKKPGYDSANSVCYIGTHDNDTARGYFASLPSQQQESWRKALTEHGCRDLDIVDALISYCLNKEGRFAILSAQDILGLGTEARLNVPGIVNDVNWTWRLDSLSALCSRIEGLLPKLKKAKRDAK